MCPALFGISISDAGLLVLEAVLVLLIVRPDLGPCACFHQMGNLDPIPVMEGFAWVWWEGTLEVEFVLAPTPGAYPNPVGSFGGRDVGLGGFRLHSLQLAGKGYEVRLASRTSPPHLTTQPRYCTSGASR